MSNQTQAPKVRVQISLPSLLARIGLVRLPGGSPWLKGKPAGEGQLYLSSSPPELPRYASSQ